MARFRKVSYTQREIHNGQHRFEHWYRDNTIYFITSRTRDGYPAFASVQSRLIFWDRFNHYTQKYGFVPWVTSLLNNHYHTLGYLKTGENLGALMQRLHGSVAKLVNDLLPERRVPFWRIAGNKDYFDGCIRDETQALRAYRYTQQQSVRHGIVKDFRVFRDTKTDIELEPALQRARELKVYLEHVPYRRYQQ